MVIQPMVPDRNINVKQKPFCEAVVPKTCCVSAAASQRHFTPLQVTGALQPNTVYRGTTVLSFHHVLVQWGCLQKDFKLNLRQHQLHTLN